jgi:hypothetical protein
VTCFFLFVGGLIIQISIFIPSLDEAFVGRGIVVNDLILLLVLMATLLLLLATVAVHVKFDFVPRF